MRRTNLLHPDETRLLNLAIDSIWKDYDTDNSNTIDANEARQMIVDITGNKNVSKQDVTDFIAHIEKEAFETTGESPNGVLEREELVYFVQHGLALTDEQRETYASRGAFQKILVDFFDGFDDLLDKVYDKEKLLLIEYVDSIWEKYDLDGGNTIDAKEVKQLIVDITGHKNVPDLNCKQFVEHIESQSDGANNGKIDKDELLHFLEDGIALSSAERKEFGSRGAFHKMLVDFFTGIDKARYRFNQEKQINVNKHDQSNDASHEEEEEEGREEEKKKKQSRSIHTRQGF